MQKKVNLQKNPKNPRNTPSLDPIFRCLMSENNEVIYREFEKGNDKIFGDYSRPTYLLHINNRKKDILKYTRTKNMSLT